MKPLLFLIPALALAQVSVTVRGTTATQAAIQVRGYSGDCTLNLYEGHAASGTAHPDVTASVDTARPDTITWADGTRIVTLGHRRGNLALAADTEYTGTVSGCGTATFRLHTTPPVLGASMPPAMPVDCTKTDCLDYPQIDWTPAGRDKWYVDPMTGVKTKLLARPEDFSRSTHDTETVIPYWSGGTGWTDPAKAASGSTSNFASTANTNPLYLYVNPTSQFSATNSVENIGLVIWGSSTGSTADDRTIDICIFKAPGTCEGTGFSVVLPSVGAPPATVSKQTGSTIDQSGGAFPTQYPRPLFAGWGGAVVRRDEYPQTTLGSASITAGVMTIASPDTNSHFQRTIETGNHIYVTGSGCTGNGMADLCTVASVTSAVSLTLTDTAVSGTRTFTAFPYGIMVKKRNTNGAVYVGFRYKYAGTNTVNTTTEVPKCSPVEATDPDGVKGHLCKLGGAGLGIYFISNDGEIVRPIAAPYRPSSFGLQQSGQSISFSSTQPNVMFATSVGGTAFYKLTYGGDYKDSVWNTDTGRYIIKPGGDAPIASDPDFCPSTTECEEITWELAISPALNTQITNNFPYFNSPPFSSWNSGVQFAGVSGDIMIMYKTIGAQDAGPCHIAIVNIISRTVIDVFSTFEPNTDSGWGAGCHAVATRALPNIVTVSQNIPKGNNTGLISAGPFSMPVLGIWRSGVESSNTALPWPIDSSYDNTCPTDIPQEYKDLGAVGNQCVRMHVRKPCNVAPNAADETLYGDCPWNSAYSLGPGLFPGNNFYDPTTDPFIAGGGDGDHFRALPPINDNGDGTLTFWAQRNVARWYCCSATVPATNPAGKNCGSVNSQMDHANGWNARMNAGTVGACNETNTMYWYPDGTLESKQIIDMSRAYAGHATLGLAPGGKMLHLTGIPTSTIMDSPLDYAEYPVKDPLNISGASFQGVTHTVGQGSIQSYVSASQLNAPDDRLMFSVDWNHLNNNAGQGSQAIGNTIQGTRTFTSLGGGVWRTQAINGAGGNTFNYKLQPLVGWSGQYAMKDVSGPDSDIAAADNNSFCHARVADECRAGSTAGQIFIKSARLWTGNGSTCNPALYWADIPCIYAVTPSSGWIRQSVSLRNDTSGAAHRLLSSAFRSIGATQTFSAPVIHPAGDVVILAPGGWTQSIRPAPLLLKLPRWEETTRQRNELGGITVRIGARTGMTHARVRFGYNTSFYCTERTEACLTDDALDTTAAPYAFEETDTLTPNPCTGGCEITIPAIPGRLTYYRVETFNGTSWTNGETMTATP